MAKKTLGSSKRLGARYGLRIKRRLDKVEKVQKGKHKCPFCNSLSVKRLSYGIWECSKCGSKFTSKAYSVAKPKRKFVSTEENVDEHLFDQKAFDEKKVEERTI